MPDVSIILPACNEEGAIVKVLRQIRSLPFESEIIVVDDGSSDSTGLLAGREGVQVLRHVLTLGAGKSVKDGIDAASCERIVMLDADGTYPVDKIPEMLTTLDSGYNLVIGARHGREYHGSIFKWFARQIFRMIAQFATGKRIPDINSGFRAFRRSEIRPLFRHLCNGFSLPTTMTLAHLFLGRTVAYVPVDYYKRIGKSKVRVIRDSLRTLQFITESIAYFNPTKLFLLIALLQMIIGIIGALTVSWTVLLTAGFFATLTFAMGLGVYALKRLQPDQ